MNSLKDFVTLQARLYAFLAQQDDATLHAIAGGTAQFAVLDAGEAPPTKPADLTAPSPERGLWQVVQDLSKLSSAEEQRRHLKAVKLKVEDLKKFARSRGLTGYSGLSLTNLVDVLVAHGSDEHTARAEESRTPPPRPGAEQKATSAPSVAPTPDIDFAAIAARLRDAETEEDGAAYLRAQRLDREGLLAVAGELQLTRVTQLSQTELEKRVLKQTIGARRKFAGLQNW